MVGILVYGDNHLILRGPRPSAEEARMLVGRAGMSVVTAIGGTGGVPEPWKISTKEFRENLEWAVVVPGGPAMTAAVRQLLNEMMARGVNVQWASR
ncbi:MAG: hypothetical protein K2Q23_02895 [Bryobacteraceae bacterium]|nr:hypothetical protein [Bryobacteraceae bacterium]